VEYEQAKYLWDTGFLLKKGKKQLILSPLLSNYVTKKDEEDELTAIDLSKKEYLLFHYLLSNLHDICEREKIAEIVWPEYKDYGVSDWSIDRLIARVRNKLKKQKSEYEIITVRTRGYKLVSSGSSQ
jgi:DNA-binding response OmpR family regulator